MPALPAVKLSQSEKRQLLTIVRDTLIAAFYPDYVVKKQRQLDGGLEQLKLGCFVTLTLDGELKGCIGHIESDRPITELLPALATSSAFNDRRFPPLVESQLNSLRIELSLLSEMQGVEVNEQAELQRYLKGNSLGLVLSEGDRRAVFLPQVWQQLPEPKEFIEALKAKGGWDRDYWSSNMKVEVFSVTHFSEKQQYS
ncbi:AMMECR1 domain protein [Shewanella halifaxensis HAW-EB4]|uniref:AMMECR1 domain protein n=1 Tax=Shewanella halifaxensis (strain HAW-EB4) TaxID=458817 RepID=B0TV85_SHEHH|nr:AmmeMemoRadiSam system protein A [Shewanella halifaxensis]ABZ75523.1 AMMECR1 domain protein [Shewanella halifaxensis HAW-EB4]